MKKRDSSSSQIQVHPTITAYQHFVLCRLVDYMAPNPTAVASAIIGRWIEDESEYLASLGITPEAYLRSLGRGAELHEEPPQRASAERAEDIVEGLADEDTGEPNPRIYEDAVREVARQILDQLRRPTASKASVARISRFRERRSSSDEPL